MKKYLSCLLILLALVLPVLGMEAEAASGTCGDNVTWTLDDAGTLTISGTGAMADYASASETPWYSQRTSIKSVVVEDEVTTIGDRAFCNCAGLTDVSVGSDVKTVGTFAFQGCSVLEGITLPAAVTELKDSAFRGCTALDTMTFGGNAPTLGSYVFTDGASDMTVRYYEGSTGFDSDPWYDYYQETMHVGQWVVDTEPGCTTDGSKHIDCAYCETTITETIPSRHDYVDGVCSVCQKVELLDSGTCGSNLTWELDIRGILTISGTGYMYGYYSWSNAPWYAHQEQIVSVVIEEGVTTIGSCAFYNCSSLKSVTIPDSVTYIGNSAFIYCDSLKSISIPDSVTTIGEEVFVYCSCLESVSIGLGITTISDSVFAGCHSLKSVTIPEGVITIDEDAFYICSSLVSVTIPDSVTTIGDYAFYGCSSLKSVTIPDSVTTIDDYAFYGCSSLAGVTIPDSVTTIGYYTFEDCSSLTDIYYGGTEEQWDALDCWTEADWIHYGCTTAEGHWTSKGMAMVCSCGYTQGSIGNPGNQLHLAGYVGQTFTVEVTSGSNYDYELTGENSDHVSVSLSGISTTVTGSGTVYGKEYTLTFSQPGHYELAFEQNWTGNTFCFSADIYAKDNSFEDVAEDAYYFGPVLWAVNEGITNGMDATHFAPDATCTRGQIVTFLWRANGSPEPKDSSNPFWDVTESDYFYDAVLWAVENGITSGMGDGSFAPNAPCTRGQVATFLWRACGQPAPSGENIFTDIASGAYYYDAVLWAVEKGITNGMGDGTFAPDAPCTRGQIVTFLYRAMT